MIKKNKLSLFLLAVVMMLSVYYINMPGDELSAPTVTETVVTKYPEFASMRLELLEAREEYVVDLENILASDEYTDSAKNDAFESMQEVLELTELEVLAETFVEDLGFLDCFIENNNNYITVHVLNFVDTIENRDEVNSIIYNVFGGNIKVEIKTVNN